MNVSYLYITMPAHRLATPEVSPTCFVAKTYKELNRRTPLTGEHPSYFKLQFSVQCKTVSAKGPTE
jgi:hypothetical protein